MIPSTTIDDIRNKTDILQVIGEYVPLKKRGKNYLGLCPFHSEKTPSFTVSPDKQIFHCFGCGEGGNVFAFIMKAENVSFAESVEMLGEKIGIKVASSPSQRTTGDKEKYFAIMDLAQSYFMEQLNTPQGEAARKYVEKRGLDAATSSTFGLGFAPESWEGLLNTLTKKGASKEDLLKLGLIIDRTDKSGYYDRFRNRLMFPIYNLRGRVLGFSGRTLSTDESAKYINSPDSPIYNKGNSLFGVFQTKDDIKKSNCAVLIEGNVDLLSCYQNGIRNVVAPLGTALTQNQSKMIRRFAEKVVIAFDRDNAGAHATARSVEILKDEGLTVNVALYEGGKDPDEALKSKGPKCFLDSIENAVPWIEYMITTAISKYNIKDIESRAKAAKEVASIIGQEKEDLVKKGYIKLASSKLGMNSEELLSEMKRQEFYIKKGPADTLRRTVDKPTPKLEKAEETILKMAIENKAILELFKNGISWQELTGTENRKIAEILQSVDIDANENIGHFLLENIPDEATRNKLSKAMMLELTDPTSKKMAQDCINTIKAHHLRSKMDQLRGEIENAEKEGRLDNVSVLHKEFKDVNEAIRALSI